jgi:hypothetical protein
MVLMKVKVKALGGSSLVWMADRERRQCGSLGLEEIYREGSRLDGWNIWNIASFTTTLSIFLNVILQMMV